MQKNPLMTRRRLMDRRKVVRKRIIMCTIILSCALLFAYIKPVNTTEAQKKTLIARSTHTSDIFKMSEELLDTNNEDNAIGSDNPDVPCNPGFTCCELDMCEEESETFNGDINTVNVSLGMDNTYVEEMESIDDIDVENKSIDEVKDVYPYTPQAIYSIQTGSFNQIASAQKQFDSLRQTLNSKTLDYLRIEKIKEFYSVRLGKFDDYATAEKFLHSVKPRLSAGLIIKTMVKDERIIKLFEEGTVPPAV